MCDRLWNRVQKTTDWSRLFAAAQTTRRDSSDTERPPYARAPSWGIPNRPPGTERGASLFRGRPPWKKRGTSLFRSDLLGRRKKPSGESSRPVRNENAIASLSASVRRRGRRACRFRARRVVVELANLAD